MADVLFRMDADTAKAVQGVLKLAEAQGKTETAARKSAKSLSSIEKAAGNAGKAIGGLAAGFVSFQSVTAMLSSYHMELERATQRTTSFSNEMTGLLSLGDNIKFGDKMRRELLDLSNATGRTRQEIADLKFAAQSSAGNLSKDLQKELTTSALDLSSLTGTNSPDALRMLIKAYQAYGPEVKNVTELTAKLTYAAEQGDMTMQQLAAQFPELASSAKAVGITFDELLAALISLTQKQGDAGKAMTGLRNVVLSLEQAYSTGVLKNTGDLISNLEQLNLIDPAQLMKLFGKENLAAAKDLATSTAAMRTNMEGIATAAEKTVKSRLLEKLDSPMERAAQNARMAEQIVQNNDLMSPEQAKRAEANTRHKLEMDMIADALPPSLKFAADDQNPWTSLLTKGLMKTRQLPVLGPAMSAASVGLGKLRGEDRSFDDEVFRPGEGFGWMADMALKEAQMHPDVANSPEDIALYRASEARRRALQAQQQAGGPTIRPDSWSGPSPTQPAPMAQEATAQQQRAAHWDQRVAGLQRGGGGGGVVNIHINHANFASPASAIREMNAKAAGLPAGM